MSISVTIVMLRLNPEDTGDPFVDDRMVVDREDPNWRAAAAHDGSPPRRAAVLETTSRDHQERLREVA
jgi:hypothetical protein